MRKLFKHFLFLMVATAAVVVSFLLPEAWAKQQAPRVLVETTNYRLAKYEPPTGCYLGAYVLQDTLINGDMSTFNNLTGKKHASFFRYVGYGQPFPEEWVEEVKKVGAIPHIAWEPNQGLDAVKDDEYLRTFARKLREAEVPVFLRFASEMNGTWTAYSGDPKKYIQKWRLVHDVMEEEAPNVIMVWTVFTFPQSTILKYYPGDEYVDWVGVNIYNVVYHNNNPKARADHEDPLELLDYVYNTFSERKPIQISEYGVTHYTITDGKEYVDFAISKLSRLYEGLKSKYPRVKSIFYFNVNNLINAPEGRRINNYALTDNPRILATYAKLIQDPHFLSRVGENREGQADRELHNVKDQVYVYGGTTYISSQAVRQYLGAQVSYDAKTKTIKVSSGGKTLTLEISPGTEGSSSQKAFVKKGVSYLPLKKVAGYFGYRVSWDAGQNLVLVTQK